MSIGTALEDFTAAAHAVALAARELLPAAADHLVLRESVLAVHALGNVLKAREAELLAEAERRQAWAGTGAKNAADWLANETKSNYGDAKRKTKLGAALANNKKLKDAVDTGAVSPDTAEALADTINEPPAGAGAHHLDQLVDACTGASPRDAREAADLFTTTFATETEEQAAERRHQARTFMFGPARDGLVPVSGVLPAAMADQTQKAWLHAAGSPEGDTRTVGQRLADGCHHLAAAWAKGEVTGGRAAPQMLIVISEATWRGASNEPAVTDLGTKIPAHEARRLGEVADLRRVVLAGSEVLDLGRSERFASQRQYEALLARDGCCTWGDCRVPGSWCDADHIIEWEAGGLTDLSNLRLLCPHHHTQRHRPGVTSTGTGEDWAITLRDGTTVRRTPLRRHDGPPTPAAAPPDPPTSLFDADGRPPDRASAAA